MTLTASAPSVPALAAGRNKRALLWLIPALAVFAAGFLVPGWLGGGYAQTLLNNGLITGVLALGVAFIMRQCGLVLFGIATFYGLAAYACGILVNDFGFDAMGAAGTAVLIAGAAAFLFGLVVIRVQPLAFMMICLCMAELMRHLVALPNLRRTTGGSDGLLFMPEGRVFGIEAMDLLEAPALWPLLWSATWLIGGAFLWVALSRFGIRLRAITENEERMRFSGFNTYWPRVFAFTGAGVAAGIAGVLQALATGFASPEMFSIVTSTNALLAAITGGISSVVGPILGGVIYTWAISEFGALGYSQLFTGIAVILVLLLIPKGVLHPFKVWLKKRRRS